MALIKCKKCGKEISDEAKKCVHCGEPVILTITCSECHKEYDQTTNICPYCGKKNTNDLNLNIKSIQKTVKKRIIKHKAPLIALGVIGILIICIIASPSNNVEDYLNNGNYEKAYIKTKSKDIKKKVLIENLIATISYEISDNLKDPDSFKLSHVYYDGENEFVFEIVGKNSYGGNVTNYYDYRYDKKEKKYSLFVSLSSLEEEKTYSYDDYDEKLEKILKNVVRKTVIEIMDDKDKKIDDKIVDRINKLFKEQKLRDIKLLPDIYSIYPDEEQDGKDSV